MINSASRLPEPIMSTETRAVEKSRLMPTPILENFPQRIQIPSPTIFHTSQANNQIKSISPTIPEYSSENQNVPYLTNLHTPKSSKANNLIVSLSHFAPIIPTILINDHNAKSISPPNVSKSHNRNLVEIKTNSSQILPNSSIDNLSQIQTHQLSNDFQTNKKNFKNQKQKKSHENVNRKSGDEFIEAESSIPKAVFYNKDGLRYGVRCVCNNPSDEGFLVQCENCEMWLHAACVNYTRNIKGVPFYCPFCTETKIKCLCGKNMQYDLPLIKCQKCGNHSHKPCENIEHGRIPDNFICKECRKLESVTKSVYEIPYVRFTESDKFVADFNVFTNERSDSSNNQAFDRLKLISSLPDGIFKNMIMEDLDNTELSFRPFLERYFHTFAPLLFQGVHDFFKIFVETITTIFNVDKNVVLDGLDVLATRLLYNESIKKPKSSPKDTFANSESLDEYFSNLQVARLEKTPRNAEICIGKPSYQRQRENENLSNIENKPKRRGRKRNLNTIKVELSNNQSSKNNAERIDNDHGIFTLSSLDEGAFITDIPGFLLYTEEIDSDAGIPLSSLLITNNVVMIDTAGTSFEPIALNIRRGFHFNCIVKLVKIEGQIKTALFATKLKGPLSNEKIKRGEAITANSELILPFDGDIPYLTEKIEWKERKHRTTGNIDKSSNEIGNSNIKEVPKKKRITQQVVAKRCFISPELSLLSSFLQDPVPQLPIILVSDEDDVEIYRTQMEKLKYRNLLQ